MKFIVYDDHKKLAVNEGNGMKLQIQTFDMNAARKKELEVEARAQGLSLKQYLEYMVQDNLHLILGEGWDDD